MYTGTSKCQEGSSYKNSNPKFLKMKYFDRLHHNLGVGKWKL